eukprot:PhF_6_TR835/c0_g1_i1/m.1260
MESVWSPHFRILYMLDEYNELKTLSLTELRGLVVYPTDDINVWEGRLFLRTRKSVWVGYCHSFEIHFPDRYPLELPIIEITSHTPPTPRINADRTITLPADILAHAQQHSVLVSCMRYVINLFCSDAGVGYSGELLGMINHERVRRTKALPNNTTKVSLFLTSVIDSLRECNGNVVSWMDIALGDLSKRA